MTTKLTLTVEESVIEAQKFMPGKKERVFRIW